MKDSTNSLFLSTFFICYCSIFIIGCKSVNGLAIDINEEKIMVNTTDTLTIKASTFLLDPLPTAATKKLLVGGTTDPQFGKEIGRAHV